ncbi:copper homeostasis protein CutC [Luteolibacter sp. LG18]|uniref:copper homeostasis protein CutC n=1 Tax=Luteolibacter sp. LG18 TaxID=2819286 RepID=UPI002B2ADF4E|nr:copper homeostasis protein CutC [Luteolibacter sp. LG18]
MKLEICIDSVESAVAAERAGAIRVELCAGLMEGGITPSAGMIRAVRQRVSLGLMVIIRPRGGDFLYDDTEMEVMLEDIAVARKLGVDGIVIGALLADGRVDEEKIRTLIEAAGPLQVTFHRAFDVSRDPFESLDALASLGVHRILTSGQEASVLEGADLIRGLVKAAGERLVILPGGGITPRNIAKIAALTEASEFHLSCRRTVDSGMTWRNHRPAMGAALYPPEFSRKVADEAAIRGILSGNS